MRNSFPSYPFSNRLFIQYLTSQGSADGDFQPRSKYRIYALYEVYEAARRSMDDFQGELSAYLLRAGQLNFSEPYDLPFPADDVKAKFCATTLFHNDVEMLFFGLPDTMWRAHPDQRLELLRKSDQVKEVRKTMALQAKIRGLDRFYYAFLTSFTEEYIVVLTEESLLGYVESFHSVHDTAIVEGLYAIEYPERIA